MACALYRHFNEQNELLYVGVSNSHLKRLSEHAKRATWASQISLVAVRQFPTRQAALAAERAAIQAERPKFNIVHNGPRAARKKAAHSKSPILRNCSLPVNLDHVRQLLEAADKEGKGRLAYNVKQAAMALDMAPRDVRWLMKTGELPARGRGRVGTLVLLDDLRRCAGRV